MHPDMLFVSYVFQLCNFDFANKKGTQPFLYDNILIDKKQ
jgi:hypothetical protein